MKIQISFEIRKKKINLYLMKIHIGFEFRKKSDLYLIKIQISFELKRKKKL